MKKEAAKDGVPGEMGQREGRELGATKGAMGEKPGYRYGEKASLWGACADW